ncbi:MAG: NAD(+)/NADH kinase [Pseudomonadales bacterium]|nr:NAD(+)/NADH kinase [Pseudomonadales bacterium]
MSKVGICVNPMSGRDVRRLAARASNMTHEMKRDMVARIAVGADAVGVGEIYIAQEPFNISNRAIEHLNLKAQIHTVKIPITHSALDTEKIIESFVKAGCTTIVSIGGDGTNRAIIRKCRDITLVPLSTGTNNVFPQLLEATTAGMVAAIAAGLGKTDKDLLCQRCKVIDIHMDAVSDITLIDAVLLKNDHVGNLLPFDAKCIDRILLTRAEPDAIGMSPIGGYKRRVEAGDDSGLLVQMGGENPFSVPLSPGLFDSVSVSETQLIAFDQEVIFAGPGVLALDGDRDYRIAANSSARMKISRTGPEIMDVRATMQYAVEKGIIGA